MKTIQTLILLAGLSAGISIMAAEPSTDTPAKEKSAAPAATDTPDSDKPVAPPSAQAPAAELAPVPVVPSNDTNADGQLRLNFRGAPLEKVLDYLSEAAGFIIVLDTQVRGKVDVWSNQPLSKDEAVNVLNSVLNKNGYAAIRNDRTLTIVNKDEAKTKAIPVVAGGDPESIPKTDEIVTQIIPVRYVEAAQVMKDLQPLVSALTTMTANESGNSIVITDTRANIRRVAEVIKAIDGGAEDETQVRVFQLKHHDPVEMANLLTGLFSDQGSSGGSQSPIRFGNRGGGGGGGGGGRFGGGGPGGGFGGPGGGFAALLAANAGSGGGGQTDRLKKRQRVVAVADARTSSVVVTAARDLMDQIGTMVEQLDHDSPKVSKVSVIHLDNADPQQVQQVLQDMFQSSTARNRNSSTQTSPLQTRIQQNQNSTTTGTGFGTSGSSNTRGRTGFQN